MTSNSSKDWLLSVDGEREIKHPQAITLNTPLPSIHPSVRPSIHHGESKQEDHTHPCPTDVLTGSGWETRGVTPRPLPIYNRSLVQLLFMDWRNQNIIAKIKTLLLANDHHCRTTPTERSQGRVIIIII